MTPCRCGCGANNSQPCRNPRYQPRVVSPHTTRMLRWSLMMEHRSGPVDRDEPGRVTENVWRRVRAAYGHLCDRAEAWGVEPAEQLAVEDTEGLYETAPKTASLAPLPAEPPSLGVMGPPKPVWLPHGRPIGRPDTGEHVAEFIEQHCDVAVSPWQRSLLVAAYEKPGLLSRAWKWVTR